MEPSPVHAAGPCVFKAAVTDQFLAGTDDRCRRTDQRSRCKPAIGLRLPFRIHVPYLVGRQRATDDDQLVHPPLERGLRSLAIAVADPCRADGKGTVSP